MKVKTFLAVISAMFIALISKISPAHATGVDVAELGGLESLFTGLLPIILSVGFVLFIIKKLVEGLLGTSIIKV